MRTGGNERDAREESERKRKRKREFIYPLLCWLFYCPLLVVVVVVVLQDRCHLCCTSMEENREDTDSLRAWGINYQSDQNYDNRYIKAVGVTCTCVQRHTRERERNRFAVAVCERLRVSVWAKCLGARFDFWLMTPPHRQPSLKLENA